MSAPVPRGAIRSSDGFRSSRKLPTSQAGTSAANRATGDTGAGELTSCQRIPTSARPKRSLPGRTCLAWYFCQEVRYGQLTITLKTSDLSTIGSFPVVVSNPTRGGVSNSVAFTVAARVSRRCLGD
jgi:hypothetical protein